MGEEGVDKSGKVGVNRKLVAGIVVVVLVIAGIGAIISLNKNNSDDDIQKMGLLYFDTRDMGDVWHIRIVHIKSIGPMDWLRDDLNESRICYQLSQRQNNYQNNECFYLKDIKTNPSPLGVTWVNLNNTESVEVGDYFIINKTGGSGGKAEPHDKFQILSTITIQTYNNWVYLPPAEFLDMDVVKTSAGWNMTVTWVNETVPGELLMWPNMTDQIEDLSGNVVNVIVGPVNHPYNQVWHDIDNNSFLSIGDVIEIRNTDDELESGYLYRLMSKKYGYMHTMIEMTLN